MSEGKLSRTHGEAKTRVGCWLIPSSPVSRTRQHGIRQLTRLSSISPAAQKDDQSDPGRQTQTSTYTQPPLHHRTTYKVESPTVCTTGDFQSNRLGISGERDCAGRQRFLPKSRLDHSPYQGNKQKQIPGTQHKQKNKKCHIFSLETPLTLTTGTEPPYVMTRDIWRIDRNVSRTSSTWNKQSDKTHNAVDTGRGWDYGTRASKEQPIART